MGAAIAHGRAKALRGAQRDVRAPFARRREQGQRQQVGGNAQERAIGMRLAGQRAQVMNAAGGGRVLRQHAKIITLGHELRQGFGGSADLDFNAQRFGAGLDHFNRLRMAVARHNKNTAFAFHAAPGQRHGLGGGGGFVEHGGICNGHGGQVGYHGLEVEQRFQTAL